MQGGNVNAGSKTPGDEEAGWEEACRREEEIRRLVAEEQSGVIGRAAVGDAAAKLGISVASLYRLIQRFREDRRVSVLLPRKAGRPAGTRYISEGVEAFNHSRQDRNRELAEHAARRRSRIDAR